MDLVTFLAAAGIGALAGGLFSWIFMRARLSAERAHGRTEGTAEISVANERIRSLECEKADHSAQHVALKMQAESWREALDVARDERAQFAERASRVPDLESQILKITELQVGLNRQLVQCREDIGRMTAELDGQSKQLTGAHQELIMQREMREQSDARNNKLESENAALLTRLESERQQSAVRLEELLGARTELANQFKSLANEILEEKAKRFAEQNQTNLGQLLDPLKEKLVEFQAKVETVYVQESKDRTALGEQVRQLMELNKTISVEAHNLTTALKGSNKAQGSWGELILEQLLTSSGLQLGQGYDVQLSLPREDGSRAQPDVVMHLPQDRHLVVDAKVSLNAYDECIAADDELTRQAALKRHLDSVRSHVKGLSEKNYQSLYGLKSLDCVLMFIPIEPAFMLAVTNDRDLFINAWEKNVLLVSPSTLLFVVRTVAHLWRQEAQNKNAQDIAKRGAELYDKLVGFVTSLQSLGNRLEQARKDYDDAVSKLSTGRMNVIRQAQMLKDLGIRPSKGLPDSIQERTSNDEVAESTQAVTDIVGEVEEIQFPALEN